MGNQERDERIGGYNVIGVTDAQGGANGTGGSATETTVQQLDARKCSMSLHAQGITK